MTGRDVNIKQNAFILTIALHLFLIAALMLLKVNYNPTKTEYIEIDVLSGKNKVKSVSGKGAKKGAIKSPVRSVNVKEKKVEVKLPQRRNFLNDEEVLSETAKKMRFEDEVPRFDDDSIKVKKDDDYLTSSREIASETGTSLTVSESDNDQGQREVGISGGESFGEEGTYRINWEGGEQRQVVYRIIPEIPENVERSVELPLKFMVNSAGEVLQIIPLKKIKPELEKNTIEAFSKWRFSPSTGKEKQWGKITFIFVIH